MRTTVYLNSLHFEKLETASKVLNLSTNEIVTILLTRMTDNSVFSTKPYETVKYQTSNPDIIWITMHVTFKPVFYEKVQDLRRNYKFSVSWFISYAINKYLDIIVKKMKG